MQEADWERGVRKQQLCSNPFIPKASTANLLTGEESRGHLLSEASKPRGLEVTDVN